MNRLCCVLNRTYSCTSCGVYSCMKCCPERWTIHHSILSSGRKAICPKTGKIVTFKFIDNAAYSGIDFYE